MPLAKSLSHRTVDQTNLPYISNNSPTSTQVLYAAGSNDILTQITGWAQRRPGFSDSVEATPTTFTNLQRMFTWERFDGSIYIMFCDVTATTSKVYKMQSIVEVSATLIYTDTGSNEPFDFVVSNNTLYFSNGNIAKKWDPINGVTNWGISIGSTSDSAYVGTGANSGGASWSNPTNFQGAPDGSFTVATRNNSGSTSYLTGTNLGLAVSATNTITGVQVNLTGKSTLTSGTAYVTIALTYLGSIIGAGQAVLGFTSSSSTQIIGSSSDLWFTGGLSYSIVNDSTFGVLVFGTHTGIPGSSATFSMDAAQIVVYSTNAPTIAVSGSSGTMSATVGYQYVYTYGNSNTGHVSSPTVPSVSTGVFTNKLNVGITVVASTDSQVNQIHVYRTTDSATGLGGQTYFEIPNSPFANNSTTVTDDATDAQLNVYSIAPTPTFNDPPPLWQGMTYYSGRIWGYIENKVWFTGLEEIINGVPEESVPSGVAGNFYSFDQPVLAVATAGIDENQKLLVFCPGRIYSIQGTTLDTFRRRRIADRRGCRNRTCVTMMGGVCAWLDTANQIWTTDGTSIEELSVPIRPDLEGINQLACSMSFHVSGSAHWLVFSSGESLLVYDIDSEQWMPPWNFSAQYIYSGETEPGNYTLMAAKPTKALKLNMNSFNDDGTTYAPEIVTNLFSLIPDTPGVSDDASRTGAPWYVEVDTNNITLDDVSYLVDDDTDTGTYTSLNRDKSMVEVTFNRKEGRDIKQQVYTLAGRPACRWFSISITLQDAEQRDIIYGYDVAYTVTK